MQIIPREYIYIYIYILQPEQTARRFAEDTFQLVDSTTPANPETILENGCPQLRL